LHVTTPEVSKNVRLETGFIQGDEVSVHYDPMIAKLVVRGEDRNDALRILRRALDSYNVSVSATYIWEPKIYMKRRAKWNTFLI
jgi:acetyl/propionyl-CoA carboxylase alpha subunit